MRTGSQPIAFDPTRVRLGETTTMRKESVLLALDQITTHVAVLGSTGSGKTTAALAIVEQLLERDVPVLLVDRKGDLARYASRAWWADATADDRERRAALRERIDIDLFTPGNSQGRPLRLPVIPLLDDATTQERDQLARFAAAGLATMMGYGTGTTHRHKLSVLQCAIQLHADEREVTINLLRDTINQPDPELLTRVGPLQRFFAPLSEDLQTLEIQRGVLLAGDGEPLDAAALLPPSGARPKLSIINTSALTEVPVLQFWISRLLVELGRLARKRPSKTLQGAVFFDEADAYIPASSSPPTKEPMFELLRRARSEGLGVMLATQNPGDIDYKARDNIGTWLVGKVAQDRAIEKMRNLLASYPNVASRLATQPTGHFFVLGTGVKEIKSDRSMMVTEQLADPDIAELARATRP
jgi:DNA helicase HerA-like ATPase